MVTNESSELRIADALAVADELIDLVRGVGELGGFRGDTSALVMFGAFRRGFRRLLRIRELAAAGAGAEAAILTRSLLSILVRSAYVDEPDDSPTRHERFDRYRKRQRQDSLETSKLLQAAGFEVGEAELAELPTDLVADEARRVKDLPPDRQLFEMLDLHPLYARVYFPASDLMHFSLEEAVSDMLGVETVPLEAPEWNRASEALWLAVIVSGVLLERSERSVKHGLLDGAREIVTRHFSTQVSNATPEN
jgi:uncharacterized protein DUF5677